MQLHNYIDSITIQVINIECYIDDFISFYALHSLMFIEADNPNIGDYKPDIIVSINNTRNPIIYSYHNGDFDGTTYTTFAFAGLKKYNKREDKRRLKILNKFIDFLIKIGISYRLKKIDLAYDIHINKSIKNFFPIRVNKQGLKSTTVNPFDYYEQTTLYVEDKSTQRPSLRAYIYDKSAKEDLEEKIFRFEISIRNIKSKLDTFEELFAHIQKQILKYRCFYFPVIAECNKNKSIYKKNEYKFSKSLEKSIIKSGGEELNLTIAQEIEDLLKKLYCYDSFEIPNTVG